MKCILPAALLWAWALAGQDQRPDPNVNSRYTVESVEISGVKESLLSKAVRRDLHGLVGQNFSENKVAALARRIKSEIPSGSVSPKVTRGDKPEQVKIVFVVTGRHRDRFEMTMPGEMGLYHSKEGWSGALEGTVRVATSSFTAGLVSNSDLLVSRYAGVVARYENSRVGTSRVRLGFQFESYHEAWNAATETTLAESPSVPGIYRTRQNFEPTLTFVVAAPLKLTVGTSFERFQTQFPAAHTEAANAVITTLRYDRQLEGSGVYRHRLTAGYGLRAATRTFDSDYVYARHVWDFRYRLSHGNNVVNLRFLSGIVSGRAPLFERFVLGNSQTLRGWSRYDVAPLGGTRMAHNSLDYRYKAFRAFYDVGADWDSGKPAGVKHSLGVGLRLGELSLLVGFPVRSGHADPVFMAGLNL